MRCKRCRKEISSKMIHTASGDNYHEDCFVCSKCGKRIVGRYNEEKDKLYHLTCFREQKKLYCEYCKKLLNTSWVDSNGKKYHKECFRENIQPRCNICKKLIDGKFVRDKDGQYHKECFNEHKMEKCSICGNPLEKRYIKDYWGNKVHEKHGKFAVEFCECCGRAISEKTSKGGYKINNNWTICGICIRESVTKTTNLYVLKQEVQSMLLEVGIQIPLIKEIVLIDKKNLKRISKGNGDSRGCALTKTMKQNNKIIKMEHSIYILSSMQKTLFQGVLAHEMLHIWLNQNSIKMGKKETEGFCELGPYLVYSKSKNEISGFLLKQLEDNKYSIYSEGFKMMKKKLEKIGWKNLIQKMLH